MTQSVWQMYLKLRLCVLNIYFIKIFTLEILEYDGVISMAFCRAQKTLGYHYYILHMPANMTISLECFTRRFGKLIAQCVNVATLLSNHDKVRWSAAFFGNLTPHKYLTKTSVSPDVPMTNVPV